MLPTLKCSTVVFPLLFSALIVVSSGCGFHNERPVHRDKTEVGTDAKGRIVYKKFEQLIDDYSGRSLATIIQQFGTAGRLVSEFGTDHPRLGKQYLYEIFYGDKMRVINYFRWPKIDSVEPRIISPTFFVEQNIVIDTASLAKQIIITKISSDSKTFAGRYLETFPSLKYTSIRDMRYRSYTFRIPLQNFVFDDKTRLILKDAIIMN